MSMYVVVVPDQSGDKVAATAEDVDGAVTAATSFAANGAKPKIYQEVGEVILTPRLLRAEEPTSAPSTVTVAALPPPATTVTNGTNGHARPARTAAVVAAREAGSKRTSGDLQRTRTRILSYVMTNPGRGAEDMGRALNMPTKDLVLPIRQLIEEGKMRKVGQARAVKYHPPLRAPAKKAGPVKKAVRRAA